MNRVVSVLYVSLLVLCLVFPVGCLVSPVGAAEKEWTFMVFLNADNDLDSLGVGDMGEMSQVGSNDYLNILCLIDREKGPATLNYIEKGKATVLKEMGELDMGDYKVLVQFVKNMAAAYPAKHYAVVVWNHGSGWKDNNGAFIKGISYDDSTGDHITTEQLGAATGDIKAALGKNLDIFCMDACLMQMAEVAYAMKGNVDYIVGSEETEPGEGYPYDDILNGLKAGMSPANFAKHMVAAYAASYEGGSQGSSSSTQSALDMSQIEAFKDAVNGFAKASIAGNFGSQFKGALNKVQKFRYRTNIDLGHLAGLLKLTIKDDAFQTAADKLIAANNALILSNGLAGTNCKYAQGLAVYFPMTSYSFSAPYNDLAFAKDTLWDEMIQDYYKKTTAPAIVSDVERGDMSSLMSYVSTANENNREVSSDLVSKLNFRAYSEGGLDHPTMDSVQSLVKELKTK